MPLCRYEGFSLRSTTSILIAGRLSPQQQELMQRFVPTVVRANKACYVAEYDKSGGGGISRPAPPAMVHCQGLLV